MKKRCSKCNELKPIACFSKNKSKKEGINSQCKNCQRQYNGEYYIIHKENLKEYQKKYNKKHKLKITQRTKTYRENNKEYFEEYNKSYYLDNKEKIINRVKEYRKTENGKLSKAKDRHRRRAMQSKLINDLTVQEKNIIIFLQNYKCIGCKKYFDEVKPTIDHIMPLIDGGGLTKNNVQMLCLSCNSGKKNNTIDFRNEMHQEVIKRV
jgi:5-methylcytosine-specific restriction endonuclease McrA